MASRSGDDDAGCSSPGISYELRARDLPSKRLLGKGLASIAYETEWNGERFARKDFIGVPSGSFQKEASILVGLKDHKNVVKTHGWTVGKLSCSLVLEYVEEDLLDLLKKRKESQRRPASIVSGSQSERNLLQKGKESLKRPAGIAFGSQSEQNHTNPFAAGLAFGSRSEQNHTYPFDLAEALDIVVQIARGMKFLHAHHISHGDLKTKNILVTHTNDGDKKLLTVKVADFGLVRTKSKSMSFVSRHARKLDMVQWQAPEILEGLLLEDNEETSSESDSDPEKDCAGPPRVIDGYAADVYSFAVTCSQILTGEDPYPIQNWKELGPKIVSGELRPNFPTGCLPLLKRLLIACWRKVPAARPTFSSILELLELLHDPQIMDLMGRRILSEDRPKEPEFNRTLEDKLLQLLRSFEDSESDSDSDSAEKLKGIQFRDLEPSCEQFIQVGDQRINASLYFTWQVREAIHSVTHQHKEPAKIPLFGEENQIYDTNPIVRKLPKLLGSEPKFHVSFGGEEDFTDEDISEFSVRFKRHVYSSGQFQVPLYSIHLVLVYAFLYWHLLPPATGLTLPSERLHRKAWFHAPC